MQGDEFELKDDAYTLIYEGSAPTDCTVDNIGNLYFSTVDNHIFGTSYVDLYQRRSSANE